MNLLCCSKDPEYVQNYPCLVTIGLQYQPLTVQMLLHMDKIQEQLLSEMILQTGTYYISVLRFKAVPYV